QQFQVAYGYANASGGDIMVLNRDFSGTVSCGPVSVAKTSQALPVMTSMGYGSGRFVTAYNDYNFTTSVGTQHLLVLNDDCTAAELPVQIQPTCQNAFLPAFAGGDQGFAFVWVDAASFPPKLMLRTFGPNL